MKQETLEEAAEIWINNRFTKQICGDKSYPDIYASKKSIIESHIIFAKSQGKIMYSEEDVEFFVKKVLEDAKKSVIWSEDYYKHLTKELLQLWKEQQPKTLYYE